MSDGEFDGRAEDARLYVGDDGNWHARVRGACSTDRVNGRCFLGKDVRLHARCYLYDQSQ